MKVLHVIASLEIGGAQQLLVDLLPLQATSDDVHLLVYERVHNDYEKALEQAGINIICLNECNFHNPRILFHLRVIRRRFQPSFRPYTSYPYTHPVFPDKGP